MSGFAEYFKMAMDEPWLFIFIALVMFLYRASVYTGKRLFDEDKGIITNYTRDLKKGTEVMQERIGDAFDAIKETSVKIEYSHDKIIDKIEDNHKKVMQAIEKK